MKKKILLITLCICIIVTGSIVYLISQKNLIKKNKRESISNAIWHCLQHPKEMTLFSIDPIDSEDLKPTDKENIFHGFKSLGSTPILNLETQGIIAKEIENAVTAMGKSQAKCFWPRHGVRITDGKSVYDFLICFECYTLHLYEDERKTNEVVIGGSGDVFNEILIKANVPLPKEEK